MRRPGRAARVVAAIRATALPGLPEPVDRRVQRGARESTCAPDPRTDRRRQVRQRDRRLHGGALRRFRAVPAAGQGDHVLLWVGPLALLLVAVFALFRTLKTRRARVDDRPLTEAEHAEAQRLLETVHNKNAS